MPWCAVDHESGAEPRAHRLELGPFPGPDRPMWSDSADTRVTLMQIDEGGKQGTPFVRVEFTTHGQPRVIEVPTSLAGDLGDLLASQLGVVRRALACSLTATYWLTGAGE